VGHENVGVVQEVGGQVRNVRPGDRVVVDPLLSCEAREVDPPCPGCARGDRPTCRSFSGAGGLSAGILIGGCRDTGGGWSPAFVAHESQVFSVPDGVDDLGAVMAEPFAVALRAVLLNPPREGETCLVLGSGAIGLTVIAALRALGYSSRVVALARHPFQAELARRYGADEVISARGDYLAKAAGSLGTNLLRPVMGPPVLESGAELVFECAGGSRAFADALRLAAPRGRVVLVGLTAVPRNVDCSFIWLRELTVRGSFCYGVEGAPGDRARTFARALKLMDQGVDLSPLVTHRFPLEEYRRALRTVTHKASTGAVRAIFEFPS
jgi:threonine dehydrogenase-like Zn-dependent dehydrogenase